MTSFKTLVFCLFALPAMASAASLADIEFVNKAGHDNLAEQQTGQLAATQGESPAIRAFGERMVADHGKAYQALKQAAAKSEALVPTQPTAAQAKAAEALQALEGAAFDQKYAQMMAEDHEKAVALFRMQSTRGTDPDLKAYATATLPTLEEHLSMAKALMP
jgi:putative membrane protein